MNEQQDVRRIKIVASTKLALPKETKEPNDFPQSPDLDRRAEASGRMLQRERFQPNQERTKCQY